MSTNKAVSVVFMLFSLAMFASTFAIEEHSFVQGVSARFWPQAVLVDGCEHPALSFTGNANHNPAHS